MYMCSRSRKYNFFHFFLSTNVLKSIGVWFKHVYGVSEVSQGLWTLPRKFKSNYITDALECSRCDLEISVIIISVVLLQ